MFAKKSWSANFCERMYAPGPDFYCHKLSALGFRGHNKVLDAGCGFGQWTLALSHLNQRVIGIDILPERVREGHSRSYGDTDFIVGSVEETPFPDRFFDAVFCFSVIYFTDIARTLKEFHRILRRGGKLYLNSNGVGWYIYELLGGRRPEALRAFFDSIMLRLVGRHAGGSRLISSVVETWGEMEKAGFVRIRVLPIGEGTHLFQARYFGLEGVFEMMAEVA